jgi:hypothetical protein
VPGAGPQWVRAIVADPGFAAEHLADEAVRRLGPQAQEWVDRMRERYPQARADALAQLAVDEHVRLSRKQGLASTTAPGAIIDLGLLGRTQARLALTIAASYGVDPTDPARADELLELLAWPRLTEPGPAVARHAGRMVSALVVRRLAARLLPFGATVAGSIHSGASTETIGRRAVHKYRPRNVGKGPLFDAQR